MPTVVIPYRGGCEHREAALEYVLGRYDDAGLEAIVSVDDGDGPWVKARPVAAALKLCDEVVVVADADVFCHELEAAVEAVEAGYPWAMPHKRVLRLDQESTAALLADEPFEPVYARPPYTGVWGGGIVVMHRDTLAAIPLDPRFEGWGQEDESAALAWWCLLGPCWRGGADLMHLWHPLAPRRYHRIGSLEGRRLHKRYIAVRNDPVAMRRLIEEAR